MPFTLDSEIITLTWQFGGTYCICYRYFYYCFLFFLPLTALFLAFHLFVENCKWNFAGEDGFVPRWDDVLLAVDLRWRLPCRKMFFLKMRQPRPLFHLFSPFQKHTTIFITFKLTTLLEHESRPITTRPGLQPSFRKNVLIANCGQSCESSTVVLLVQL